MSRKLSELLPEVEKLASVFLDRLRQEGIAAIVTCTYRSQAEQDELYAQGRTKPGKVVTKAKVSKHTSRRAFDIAIVKDGHPCWDIKVSVDGDTAPDYIEAGKIGQALGLRWGGDFDGDGIVGNDKFIDYPHYEWNG